MKGSADLFINIDGDVADADFLQAEAEFLADSGSDFGVPVEVGSGGSVELGPVLDEEFLLGGGGHGDDVGGPWLSHVRLDVAA